VKPLHSRLSAISLATLLLAATAANAERTFKWIDAQGNTHYGDRIPMQSAAQRREEINEQGRTLKAYDKPATAEEISEQKRQARLRFEEQKLQEEQAKQDRQLLATYANENDILIARDNKIDAIKEFIHMTDIRIDSLQKRLAELTEEAADYEGRGKPVPEFVQHQTASIRDQIDQNREIITLKQAEMEKINETYAAEMLRYQTLQNRRLSTR